MRRPARGCSSRGGRERAAVGSDGGEREMAGGGEGEDAVAEGNGCEGWAGGGGEDGVDFGGCGDPPAATAVAEDERGIRRGEVGSIEPDEIFKQLAEGRGRHLGEFAGGVIGRLKRGGVGGELNERDAKGDVHRPMMETRAWVEPRRTLPVLRLPSSRAWSRTVRRAVSPLSLFAPRVMKVMAAVVRRPLGATFGPSRSFRRSGFCE